MAEWESREFHVGDVALTVRRTGAGPPLLLLHDELGPPLWQEWVAALAQRYELITPLLPGFAGPRIAWVHTIRDLAPLIGALVRSLFGQSVNALGLSLGGWLAAEMAVQNPRQFRRLALVAPFGLKPESGAIADMFLMTSAEYIRAGFVDPDQVLAFRRDYVDVPPETIEAWEDARVECAQLGWQPYMHEPAMAHLLPVVGDLPVLVIRGEQDRIVPPAATAAYAAALPDGHLATLGNCGHRPEVEAPDEFVRVLVDHFDEPSGRVEGGER